jgi:hypothetical protein
MLGNSMQGRDYKFVMLGIYFISSVEEALFFYKFTSFYSADGHSLILFK